jgi:TetR/AcrR family transcriptional regulator, regulator of autoinduction and epiphytic fitness
VTEVVSEMTDDDGHGGEHVDGRTARSVRTHEAIVEACLALLDDGDLRPTGPRIAARAGVSVRSIFQHFSDLEALFSAVGAKVATRVAAHLEPVDPALPSAERVARFCHQRAAVLEELSPVLRAALVHGPTSEVIHEQAAAGHRFFRNQIDEVFATERTAATDPMALHHALVVATSWGAWELLRSGHGLDVDEAREQMIFHVRLLLAGVGSGERTEPADTHTARGATPNGQG